MNVFIASDEIVSAIHFQIRYDTADKQVYRYSDRRTRFVLETNILPLRATQSRPLLTIFTEVIRPNFSECTDVNG